MGSIWPSAPFVVDPHVRHLITRFFEISDSPDPASGRLFAEELFTDDGFFKTHEKCVFKGRDAIAASRQQNSPVIESRSHELFRVYAADSPATDLVVLGRFEIRLKDGNTVHLDFTARFIVAQAASEGEAKLQLVRVWTEDTGMKAAIEKATATLTAANKA